MVHLKFHLINGEHLEIGNAQEVYCIYPILKSGKIEIKNNLVKLHWEYVENTLATTE